MLSITGRPRGYTHCTADFFRNYNSPEVVYSSYYSCCFHIYKTPFCNIFYSHFILSANKGVLCNFIFGFNWQFLKTLSKNIVLSKNYCLLYSDGDTPTHFLKSLENSYTLLYPSDSPISVMLE